MVTWLKVCLWLVLILAVIAGTMWYGMSLVVDADVRGVPLP